MKKEILKSEIKFFTAKILKIKAMAGKLGHQRGALGHPGSSPKFPNLN